MSDIIFMLFTYHGYHLGWEEYRGSLCHRASGSVKHTSSTGRLDIDTQIWAILKLNIWRLKSNGPNFY